MGWADGAEILQTGTFLHRRKAGLTELESCTSVCSVVDDFLSWQGHLTFTFSDNSLTTKKYCISPLRSTRLIFRRKNLLPHLIGQSSLNGPYDTKSAGSLMSIWRSYLDTLAADHGAGHLHEVEEFVENPNHRLEVSGGQVLTNLQFVHINYLFFRAMLWIRIGIILPDPTLHPRPTDPDPTLLTVNS